ncbi:hypothetical protein LCGC14_0302250 [marine sediment metagenome]|uniref:Tyr recombinase domain-containing protein n=1 Tax=marine sediment metagenome TaxID=412755 RepID=A0A0F9U710_9ZZZZ
MATRKHSKEKKRFRIGSVSVYKHRRSWWLYYRENGAARRRRASQSLEEARVIAAEVNAQLAGNRPTIFSFQPISVEDLTHRWLDYHEHVRRSSVATCQRYRTAVEYLVRFVGNEPSCRCAHKVNAEAFLRYVRAVQVAPNGHRNARKRGLRDKGIKFILGACRSMYGFAHSHRFLPPYADNPFAALAVDRMPVEDAKRIHVFAAAEEFSFLSACDDWQFPVFYILAKTGLRSGELAHLLIEDIDLVNETLHVRSKSELGWQVKTRNARSIPLPPEPIAVLQHVIGQRREGVLFLRRSVQDQPADHVMTLSRDASAAELAQRADCLSDTLGRQLTRVESFRLAKRLWRDAGAAKTDTIRTEFMRITRSIGLGHVTAPKCWRHTFATLLQEAGVDPLIRQQTMGHAPAGPRAGALGMTAHYTHTQAKVHRRQLASALSLRPRTSDIVADQIGNGAKTEQKGEQQ